MRRILKTSLAVILLVFVCMPAFTPSAAFVIYVNADATGDNNGTSWVDAFVDLQDALMEAIIYDEIWVADGVYKPSVPVEPDNIRTAAFRMSLRVAIYGGFAGGEENLEDRNWEINEAILSGDIGVPGDPTDNCYHVFYHPQDLSLSSASILDGFTISGGYANASSSLHNSGGGMYNHAVGMPTIANCTFTDNYADNVGGAIYNISYRMYLNDCVFIRNQADNGGGGIYNGGASMTITRCSFLENSAGDYGGGIWNYRSSPTLIECTFIENTANVSGGGVRNNHCTPILTECEFIRNTASESGGGMQNYNASPTLTECEFFRNIAGESGGGIINTNSDPILTGCSLTGNTAIRGAGILNENTSSSNLMQCLFFRNYAYYGGGMYNDSSRPFLTDCIFEENTGNFTGGGMHNELSSPQITNCSFLQNMAENDGGGIYSYYSYEALNNCILSDNTAFQDGGGLFSFNSWPDLINCTFTNNRAYRDGGGLANFHSDTNIISSIFGNNIAHRNGGGIIFDQSQPSIINNTISKNSALEQGGGLFCGNNSDPDIKNSILWGNTPREICFSETGPPNSIGIAWSDVQGGEQGIATNNNGDVNWHQGNIDQDPLFVDPGRNFHLTLESSCIDAGDPSPDFNDECQPPGLGAETNDMGTFGGPHNCGWDLGVYSVSGSITYMNEGIPVQNTILSLTGLNFFETISNNEGDFVFTEVPEGDYTLTPSKDSDVSGITAYDAACVAQFAAELIDFDEYQTLAADVTGNNEVTAYDAAKILRYSIGLDYDSLAGTWGFLPEEYRYRPLVNDQMNQNYKAILFGEVTGDWSTGLFEKSEESGALLYVPDVKAYSGALAVVPVLLKSGRDLIALEGFVKFDPGLLQFVEAAVGKVMPGWTIAANPDNKIGKIAIATCGANSAKEGSVLCNFKFKVTGKGNAKINYIEMVGNTKHVEMNSVSSIIIQ